MSKFDLSKYETVAERLEKFHKDFPTARVITAMEHYDESRVVFRADLYKQYEDEKPISSGYAEETRGEGGMVNSTSHLENCETSAIGRALANAGYAPTDARPSREEMQKVERATYKPLDVSFSKEPTSRDVDGRTYCKSCGHMISKNVEEFSVEHYGKALCMNCQKTADIPSA